MSILLIDIKYCRFHTILTLNLSKILFKTPLLRARNFRTMLIYRMLEVHILNRVQNCTRLVLHTNCTRQSRTGRTQMPFGHKEKNTATEPVAVFCSILPNTSVIRLGLCTQAVFPWVSTR